MKHGFKLLSILGAGVVASVVTATSASAGVSFGFGFGDRHHQGYFSYNEGHYASRRYYSYDYYSPRYCPPPRVYHYRSVPRYHYYSRPYRRGYECY